jgi:hypothetical protein
MDTNQSENQGVDDNEDTEDQNNLESEDQTQLISGSEEVNTGEDDTEIEQTRDATQFTAGMNTFYIVFIYVYMYVYTYLVMVQVFSHRI